MFTSLFPILTTTDMPQALAFYRDLLGAKVTFEFPGPTGAPGYVGLTLGTSELGIGLATSSAAKTTLWVYAEDCDAAVAKLRAAGVRLVEEPADQPWGERVARVLDPDGNEIVIGAKLTQ